MNKVGERNHKPVSLQTRNAPRAKPNPDPIRPAARIPPIARIGMKDQSLQLFS